MTTTVKGTTRAQLNSFMLSDAPQTITINRATGGMISVTSGLPALDLPTVAPATLRSPSHTLCTVGKHHRTEGRDGPWIGAAVQRAA